MEPHHDWSGKQRGKTWAKETRRGRRDQRLRKLPKDGLSTIVHPPNLRPFFFNTSEMHHYILTRTERGFLPPLSAIFFQ